MLLLMLGCPQVNEQQEENGNDEPDVVANAGAVTQVNEEQEENAEPVTTRRTSAR